MLKLNQERGRKMGRIEFRMTENGPELTEHSEEELLEALMNDEETPEEVQI